MSRRINYRILGLFAFITFSSGVVWPVTKIGLAHLSPLWFTTLRLAIATIGMSAIAFSLKKFRRPHLSDIPLIGVVGLLQISVYILLATIGLSYLPPGRASLIGYTTPLWVMPVAIFYFKEPSTPLKWLGFALGVLGLGILMSPWDLNWHDSNTIFGSVMLLLAALGWAISIIGVRYMHWRKSPLELIPWQLLTGLAVISIYTLIKEPVLHVEWSPPLIFALFYAGFFVTGLTYFAGIIVCKELPSSVVSLGYLSVPIFSIMLSAIFMQESISLISGCAMTMILVGLACVAV